jgi:hypothetical protein
MSGDKLQAPNDREVLDQCEEDDRMSRLSSGDEEEDVRHANFRV